MLACRSGSGSCIYVCICGWKTLSPAVEVPSWSRRVFRFLLLWSWLRLAPSDGTRTRMVAYCVWCFSIAEVVNLAHTRAFVSTRHSPKTDYHLRVFLFRLQQSRQALLSRGSPHPYPPAHFVQLPRPRRHHTVPRARACGGYCAPIVSISCLRGGAVKATCSVWVWVAVVLRGGTAA